MRNNMDAAEYSHVVLGLVFLKYRQPRSDNQLFHVHPSPDNKRSPVVGELDSHTPDSTRLRVVL
ncbi:hypothetical protein [Bythopirellula goksoeyrii]|uniref:hypothetical protein n=1 Tax=Bythopirellula goksoeyrii TaxID=1400387 RepID=UPI0028F4559E|nr:hypothetical protein [Bythopirellula goksoeyrii]